ncbi:MAG: DciA family protein [Planctomycetota bacterium]|nr:DciA family protein [Planctomycetota bacterium]
MALPGPTPPESAGRARRARPASELVGAALRSLGLPSQRITQSVHEAWDAACEDGWSGKTNLLRLEGGVLEVAVASEALRHELTNFHRERILAVMRAALPTVPLIGIRFLSDPAASSKPAGGERS